MAEYQLKADAKIDLLTPGEMKDIVKGLEDLLGKENPPTVKKRASRSTTDASGNLGGGATGVTPHEMYQCPVGYQAFIHRIHVDSPSCTPAAPITTGWVRFTRNSPNTTQTQIFLPESGFVAPVVITDGSNSAIWLGPGEYLYAYGAGLPVSTEFDFEVQVRLWVAEEVGRPD